jgi:hypothetical protein
VVRLHESVFALEGERTHPATYGTFSSALAHPYAADPVRVYNPSIVFDAFSFGPSHGPDYTFQSSPLPKNQNSWPAMLYSDTNSARNLNAMLKIAGELSPAMLTPACFERQNYVQGGGVVLVRRKEWIVKP